MKCGSYFCTRASDLALPYVTIDRMVFKPFTVEDITDLASFIKKISRPTDPVSQYLWDNLTAPVRAVIARANPLSIAGKALAGNIDKILWQEGFFDEQRFANIKLTGQTWILHKKYSREEFELLHIPQKKDLHRKNKMLLEESFPFEIASTRLIRPLDWRRFYAFGPGTLVQPMRRIKQRMKDLIEDGHNPAEVIDRCIRDENYMLSVRFSRSGTDKITNELKTWVLKKAGNQPRPLRGLGAAPPFAQLKRLAAYRLDIARQKAGVNFEAVQRSLKEHLRASPETNIKDYNGTLPVYDNQASWGTAIGHAKRLLKLFERKPEVFEWQILYRSNPNVPKTP